ncbi:MAG: flippase-like domain-containing protein [Deltaproteobacteria bacterium]|nr:flippase-like domain-containing protein [Deltaproteobacteria bacterium]
MMARARLGRIHVVHVLVLVLGAIAFAVVVDRVGWDAMQRAVIGAGWWFVVMAALDLASVFCDAAGIHQFVRVHEPISYWRVIAAQASGMALNRLTPGNSVGEALKVTMLMAHVPRTTAVSAIVKFNLATLYVALAVIVIGVPLTLVSLDLPARVELAVWIGTGLLVVVAVALALVVRRGALATLIEGIRRSRLISAARAARWLDRIRAIDANIRGFGDPRSRRGVAFVMGSRVLHWIGTIVVLEAAGVPMTVPLVIGMLSVGILVTWLSNVIPLGMGLADGGNYLLYPALGSAASAGLDFTMVNRTRTVIMAALGLTIMLLATLIDRSIRTASGVRRDADSVSEPRP